MRLHGSQSDLPCCAVARVIDPFNGQTANFILKQPKVIEPRIYVKKANMERY